MKLLVSNKAKLIFLLLVISVILFVVKFSSSTSLQVLDTDPKNGQEQIDFNKILKFTFNKNILENDILISISPDFSFESQITNQVLEIQSTELLSPETIYSIKLTSKKNSKFNYLFTFKTKTEPIIFPTEKYSPEEQRKVYEELDRLTQQETPLFDYVPYVTENFIIDYIKPLVLQVRLKKDTSEIRKEALDWIKAKDADKTHQIEWKSI